jgi:predicted DNA-binding transcriptional regulator AlpA
MTLIHLPKLTDEEKSKKELMTRKDVLDYLSISKSTLYRWTMIENKLPFIKINRRKFYKSSDVNNLIEKNYSPNLTL